MGWVGLLIVFPFLMAYAASSDLLTMLIPNWISLALVAAFAAVVGVSGLSWTEIGWHVGAAMLTLTITFALFAFGVIGGGDAKLAAATTLWIGIGNMMDYLLVASVLGGGLTILLLMVRAHPLPSLLRSLPFARHLHNKETGVPYGIALAAAGLAVVPQTELWSNVCGF
ncbi:A24 family peptidase [Methylobacterium gnaphalii]|uniref:Type 4 prepilin peptidase 1 n=1 Tax=Methylobacterium gnaphalii TaxID=1010610 RepID=A0A512JLT7_9HYPH|nr:prepilin peptidase [Methylobacterium gnaphalii]GEP10926.1 type 4 prepilin peptidase 1 [Methylobacterium gnaphalii]GJD69782.1 hypothetical protein MMMDOFMJ_2720 [Methylobacterium gnaphalii]GLS48090.1 type 4 prepilin peptidase 1 [Methylobacterium gnaphalii]